MDYRTFTSSLAGLKGYRREIKLIESKQSDLLYAMSGVRGISYSQVMVHGNPSVSEERRLELIDRYEEMEKRKETLIEMIKLIEDTLDRMPEDLQKMLVSKFVERKSYTHLSSLYGYSTNGMWYHMKLETEKYL